jgi:hypothetical protein
MCHKVQYHFNMFSEMFAKFRAGPVYPSGAPQFTFVWGLRVARYLVLSVVFCRSLFVPLSFFFLPLCCLSFFELRILITLLVSSTSSYTALIYLNVKTYMMLISESSASAKIIEFILFLFSSHISCFRN